MSSWIVSMLLLASAANHFALAQTDAPSPAPSMSLVPTTATPAPTITFAPTLFRPIVVTGVFFADVTTTLSGGGSINIENNGAHVTATQQGSGRIIVVNDGGPVTVTNTGGGTMTVISDCTAAVTVTKTGNGFTFVNVTGTSAIAYTINGDGDYTYPDMTLTPSMVPSQAPTSIGGYCYSGDSVVKVLGADPLHPVAKSLTEVQVGDKILARTFEGEQVYTQVRGLPRGASTQSFVNVHMNGAGSSKEHRVMITAHHTFPTCDGKMKQAVRLVNGDCLFTEDGEENDIVHTQFISVENLAAQDALTYSVEVDQGIEAISIGGVFTHARNSDAKSTATNSHYSNKMAPSFKKSTFIPSNGLSHPPNNKFHLKKPSF